MARMLHEVNGEYDLGYHEITLEQTDLGGSGLFYYRLEMVDFVATRRMVMKE